MVKFASEAVLKALALALNEKEETQQCHLQLEYVTEQANLAGKENKSSRGEHTKAAARSNGGLARLK